MSQSAQLVALDEDEYVPTAHALCVANPSVGHSYPGSQSEQSDAPSELYVPAKHLVGVAVVVDGHLYPAGQVIQLVDPAALYFPVPHTLSVVDVHEWPAEHSVQLDSPLDDV